MAKILVETSARHIHLTQEHVDILFGAGHQLTKKKDLSQPGQFACEEKVTVVGPKKELKMSVLGPVRKASQVELALTDARSMGITAPIRESGDLEGSAPCKLVRVHAAKLNSAKALSSLRDTFTSHLKMHGASAFQTVKS